MSVFIESARFAAPMLTEVPQVIQKIIEHVVPERLGFVTSFRGSVYELSTHPYGCRVLQRCFEYLPDDQTRPLLDELHKYVTNLMIDQFGVSVCVIRFMVSCADLVRRTTSCSSSWSTGSRRTAR